MVNGITLYHRKTQLTLCQASEFWWNGPRLLKSEEWPVNIEAREEHLNDVSLERKQVISMLVVEEELQILNKYSNFIKLQRVIAYCMRFYNHTSKKILQQSNTLVSQELENAERKIIDLIQMQCFKQEIKDLSSKGILNTRSKLSNLNPFLDEQGLIRVGGRLRFSNLTMDHKNPYVLPEKHHVTILNIQQEHVKLLHCGQEQLLASLHQKNWPISGRRLVKRFTRNCMRCFRVNPRKLNHMMGNLPSERVTATHRPFVTAGVDYAGPIQLKESRRRGRPMVTKGYICVFICFNTKAIHLELVGNLTTDSFIAALRRFTARRGICSKLYSDNATNFIGANAQLKQMYEFLVKNEANVKTELATRKIEWHFIPPRAPYFGGLWEAAVKSVKVHLARVTHGLTLTFEECNTFLTEIECILNSRPITSLSSSPSDLVPLTPGHFIIGDSLLQPVEISQINTPANQLSQWKHLQKVKEHFWQRWHLHQLQVRCKWHQPHPNITVGTLVLLIEDNLLPLKWITGRVIETHPGEDTIVRLVTVKTASGVFKRSVKKLCALPINTRGN